MNNRVRMWKNILPFQSDTVIGASLSELHMISQTEMVSVGSYVVRSHSVYTRILIYRISNWGEPSLSEPHTSVTALRMRVCIYAHIYAYMLAWTDHLPEILNERIQIFQEDRYRDIVKHVKASGGLLSECSVMDPERRRLKLKHAWHWFVLLPTTAGRSQAVQI